ncbi:MAG: (d)CMP kinase, partial [Azovibrio sp.]
DARDSQRPVAPLRQAPDAVLLDTDHLGIEAAVQQVLDGYAAAVP